MSRFTTLTLVVREDPLNDEATSAITEITGRDEVMFSVTENGVTDAVKTLGADPALWCAHENTKEVRRIIDRAFTGGYRTICRDCGEPLGITEPPTKPPSSRWTSSCPHPDCGFEGTEAEVDDHVTYMISHGLHTEKGKR